MNPSPPHSGSILLVDDNPTNLQLLFGTLKGLGHKLLVAKSGGDLLLTWDGAQCPPAEINVYQGAIGDYSAFTTGHCGLPAAGSATLNIPDGSWFLIVGTDGVDTDGSWSRDRTGAEMSYTGATAACPSITQHLPGGLCQ